MAGSRTRRSLRMALDVVVGLLMLYALRTAALAPGDVLQFWLISLFVLPYADLDERILGNVALGRALLAMGLVLIGFALIGDRIRLPSSPIERGVCQGLMVAFAGGHYLLRLKRAAATAQPGFAWLPAAALSTGALWLWLGTH
ncbi:MAG: hypothetical protein ABI895_11520 [Deltaproteobacteria bacterium]